MRRRTQPLLEPNVIVSHHSARASNLRKAGLLLSLAFCLGKLLALFLAGLANTPADLGHPDWQLLLPSG